MSGDAGEPPTGAGARQAPQLVPAGRVGRAHGLDGSFYVTRPRSGLLALGASVHVGGRPLAIVRRAGTEQHPIVRLEGVDDRDAAEALRGAELCVRPEALPRLAEGEWWAHELEGCTVVAGEVVLGTVTRMLELPSCEVLEVAPATGAGAVLVPMVKDAVRRIAVAERRIEVNLDFLDIPPQARETKGEGGN